jgi:hypothetical protein
MASTEFQLFRIQVFRSPQQRLPLEQPADPQPTEAAALLRKAIESRPSASSRPGVDWHIGNVEPIGPDAVYFAVGRTTRSTVPFYDEMQGNFVELRSETAPHTHVVLDVPLEVCAIGAQSKLAKHTAATARQLERLLNVSTVARDSKARFEVSAIADPEGFVQKIRRAHAVTRFRMTFRSPNAFDVEEHFIRPQKALVALSGADRGKTEISGEDLNRDVIEELARSSAATGDDASARIRDTQAARPVAISLRGSNVLFRLPEPDEDEKREAVVTRMRFLYRKVREGVQ